MTHGAARPGSQRAVPSAKMTARGTNGARGPAGRPRPRPRPLAARGPGGHRLPPRPVTPNKGGDWRGRQSPPGGAAPPRASEPRLHRESQITPAETPRGRFVRGTTCDQRLSPPSVSPVPNRRVPVRGSAPLGWS